MSSDYSHLYKPADRYFKINDLDEDRKTIVISLPHEPASLNLIDGWGLPPEDQFFRRKETPYKLIQIERESIKELQDIQKQNRQETVTGYKIIDRFWEKVEDRADELKEEIEFIKHIWWWRYNGYWFYNDGKPTYITGRHFMFLNFFYQPDIKDNDGYPEYRDRHRREFLFREYLRHTTESFAKRDEKGWAIPNDDGSYTMIDMGTRTFFGDIHPKNRRNGSTMMALSDMIEDSERAFGIYSTIVSKDGESTEEHYNLKLLPAWSNRPYFIRPIWQGSSQPVQIKYFPPKNSYAGECLMGVIDYTVSASETKKDGSKINGMLVADEEGKCLGFRELVIMADGTKKMAGEIVNGDRLMGPHGDIKIVSGCSSGTGQMYRISSKFGSFECNGEHILSLRTSCNHVIEGVGTSGIINMPVNNFIKLVDWRKRNLKLYRGVLNFEERKLDIEPYWLGIWLGDGSHSDSSITNVDKEIIDYCVEYAKQEGVCLKKRNIGYFFGQENGIYTNVLVYRNNVLIKKFESVTESMLWFNKTHGFINHYANSGKTTKEGYVIEKTIKKESLKKRLKKYNLLYNKHIPEDYLKNSRENRLQLLAGIIDTDGSRHSAKDKLCYEITQKRIDLAKQIVDLANGLGFYATMNIKDAQMKRKDGSTYHCDVGRIRIYGNLYDIPVKIERKKYPKPECWRNRDSNVSWLKVEPIGIGEYYGFALDGDHLFMLGNQVVTHNTVNGNVLTRWDVNKNAQSLGDGTKIIGYSSHISTVEDINASGLAYLDMLELSDFYQRGDNGQTTSGLADMGIPAYDGLENFIDKFGHSVINKPTDRQIELSPNAFFAKVGKGAKQYQTEKRDDFLKKGTPAAMQSYRAYVKKYPWKKSELYFGTVSDMGFDYEVLDNRLMELRKMKSLEKMPYKVGNFERENRDPEGRVLWKTDPENGKFRISLELPVEQANLKRETLIWDATKGMMVKGYEPVYKSRFTCGADPVEYSNSKDVTSSKESDVGIAVLRERDMSIDFGDDPHFWQTRLFCLSYRNRSRNPDEANEDILMACEYYGAMLYLERNKTATWQYFIRRKRGGYLKYDVDLETGKRAEKPGFYSLTNSKDELFSEIKKYIDERGHMEVFDEFLQECRDIRGKDEMTKYDRFTAHGAALLGSRSIYGQIQDNVLNNTIDISDSGFF